MLINLVSIHPHPSPQSIPLANAFLKSYAGKSAESIKLIDFFLEEDAASCATELAGSIPDAVGFSMYVWNRNLSCEIAAALRSYNPDIKLFCGGPEVTADPESVLTMDIFDFVIVGEGEAPFLSLCQALAGNGDYSGIPGILLPGSPMFPSPAALTDLDEIPSPYLAGVIDTHANPGILWQLSRGCSFSCDFCFDSRGINGVRHFSLGRAESELRYFAATGVSQVFVLDSTFNVDPKRAKKILKMIRKISPDIHFHFEVRNEFIDREMAKLFSEIACSLQIGLQSADRDVLKLVGRSFDKADFTAKVGMLNESGAVFGFDLIYGLPGDTPDGFRHTLDYALSLYPNHLDIFPLAILPGTRLASRAKALNIIWNVKPPYIVEATGSFSTVEMAEAAELAAACDIFYTRGKAVAWFNSVVAVLGLKPAELLQKFSRWLITNRGHNTKESDFSDDDIGEMQQLFMMHLFNGKLKRFLPLVLDLVNYHQQYAAVLLEPVHESSVDSLISARMCDLRFRLAPSARIVHFTYEIEELLDCGEPRFQWMFENLPKSGSHAVIYRDKNGIVRTESLAYSYKILMEQICDGNCSDFLSGTSLPIDDANDFLAFALQEGFLLKVPLNAE